MFIVSIINNEYGRTRCENIKSLTLWLRRLCLLFPFALILQTINWSRLIFRLNITNHKHSKDGHGKSFHRNSVAAIATKTFIQEIPSKICKNNFSPTLRNNKKKFCLIIFRFSFAISICRREDFWFVKTFMESISQSFAAPDREV